MPKQEKTENQKKYYTVIVKATVPLIVKFKVLAESPEEALDKIKTQDPVSKDVFWTKMIKSHASVYKYGTSMLLKVRKLL